MMRGELWRYSRRELNNVLSLSGNDEFRSTILMLKILENSTKQYFDAITQSVQSIESRLNDVGVYRPKYHGDKVEEGLALSLAEIQWTGPQGSHFRQAPPPEKDSDNMLHNLMQRMMKKIDQQNDVLKEQSLELLAIKACLGEEKGNANVTNFKHYGSKSGKSLGQNAATCTTVQPRQFTTVTQSLRDFASTPMPQALDPRPAYTFLSPPQRQAPNLVFVERNAEGEREVSPKENLFRKKSELSQKRSTQDLKNKQTNFLAKVRIAADREFQRVVSVPTRGVETGERKQEQKSDRAAPGQFQRATSS